MDQRRVRIDLKPIFEDPEPLPVPRIPADPSDYSVNVERELGIEDDWDDEPVAVSKARGRIVQTGEPLDTLCFNTTCTKICAGGSRGVLKVYNLYEDDTLQQSVDFRRIKTKRLNLLYSPLDVSWNPIIENRIASTSTNGAVVFWNVELGRLETHYKEHTRSATAIKWHPQEESMLISGSKDASVLMYDLRVGKSVSKFSSGNFEAVRDLQWCMQDGQEDLFVACDDQGAVRLWDRRRTDRPYLKFHAHHGYVSTVQFAPKARYMLSTGGGRDKYIKIWDWSKSLDDGPIYSFETVAPVGKALWRPHGNGSTQIASCSVVNDPVVHFWDIRRPFFPYASFHDHRDSACALAFFTQDESRFVSGGKDGLLIIHKFDLHARFPINYANDVSLDTAPDGLIGVAVNSLAPEKAPFIEKQAARSIYSDPKKVETPPPPIVLHSILSTSKKSCLSVRGTDDITLSTDPPKPKRRVTIVEPKDEPEEPEETRPQPVIRVSAAAAVHAAFVAWNVASTIASTYDPFRGPTQSLVRCGQPEHAAKHLTQRCFVEMALEYRMGGAPPPQLAGFNSDVAERHGLHDVARSWRLITGLILHEVRHGGYPKEWRTDEMERRKGRVEQLAVQMAEEGEYMSRSVYRENGKAQQGVRINLRPRDMITDFTLDRYEPGFRDDVLLRKKRRGRREVEKNKDGSVTKAREGVAGRMDDSSGEDIGDLHEDVEKRTSRLAKWRMRSKLRAKDKTNLELVPRTEAPSPVFDPMDDDAMYGTFGEYHQGIQPTDVRRKTNEDLAWHGTRASAHTWRPLPDEAFEVSDTFGDRVEMLLGREFLKEKKGWAEEEVLPLPPVGRGGAGKKRHLPIRPVEEEEEDEADEEEDYDSQRSWSSSPCTVLNGLIDRGSPTEEDRERAEFEPEEFEEEEEKEDELEGEEEEIQREEQREEEVEAEKVEEEEREEKKEEQVVEVKREEMEEKPEEEEDMKETAAASVEGLLRRHADENDLQTCAAICIVFGHLIIDLLGEPLVFSWITAYESMLDRLRLMSAVSEVRKYCVLPSIAGKSLSGTFLKLGCIDCRKLITNGECERCGKHVASALCAVCHRSLTGLGWSCEGCGHTSHSRHARDWFDRFPQCPVPGCDCECAYWVNPNQTQPLLLRPKHLKVRPAKAPQRKMTVETIMLCDQLAAAKLQEEFYERRAWKMRNEKGSPTHVGKLIAERGKKIKRMERRGLDIESEESYKKLMEMESSSEEEVFIYRNGERLRVLRKKKGKKEKRFLRNGLRSGALTEELRSLEEAEEKEKKEKRERQKRMDDEKLGNGAEEGKKEDVESVEWACSCGFCEDCGLMRHWRRQLDEMESAEEGARRAMRGTGTRWTTRGRQKRREESRGRREAFESSLRKAMAREWGLRPKWKRMRTRRCRPLIREPTIPESEEEKGAASDDSSATVIDRHRMPPDTPANFRKVREGLGAGKEPRVPEEFRSKYETFTLGTLAQMLEWQAVNWQRKLGVRRIVPRAFYKHPLFGMNADELKEMPVHRLQEHVRDVNGVLRDLYGRRPKGVFGQPMKRGGGGWRKRGRGLSGCSYSARGWGRLKEGRKVKRRAFTATLLVPRPPPLRFEPGRRDYARQLMEDGETEEQTGGKFIRKEHFYSAYSRELPGWAEMGWKRRLEVLTLRRRAEKMARRNEESSRVRYEKWSRLEEKVWESKEPPPRIVRFGEEKERRDREEKEREEAEKCLMEDLESLSVSSPFSRPPARSSRRIGEPKPEALRIDVQSEWRRWGERKRFSVLDLFTDEDNLKVEQVQAFLDDNARVAKQNQDVDDANKRREEREEKEAQYQEAKREYWRRYYIKKKKGDYVPAPPQPEKRERERDERGKKRRDANREARHERMIHQKVLAKSVDHLLDLHMIDTRRT